MVRRALLAVGGLAAGIAAGLGLSIGAFGKQPEIVTPPQPVVLSYVEIGRLGLPLVDAHGDLVAYVAVDASIELLATDEAAARERLPLLRHEINLVAWRSSLSAGADGRRADLPAVSMMIRAAASRALGPRVTRRVLLTDVKPG